MRDKLTELIYEHYLETNYGLCDECGGSSGHNAAVQIADNLIANGVTVQRQGHWVHDIYNSYGCSECGERETMSHRKLKKYCPHCGADMRGAEHD